MLYKATERDLKCIAIALREKMGSSALLEFPDDFIAAIEQFIPAQS